VSDTEGEPRPHVGHINDDGVHKRTLVAEFYVADGIPLSAVYQILRIISETFPDAEVSGTGPTMTIWNETDVPF
jgi:hypothetical protein